MSGIKHDLHRNSLNDFREVTGCIIGRQEGKLRSTGGRNFSHFSVKNDARKGVNRYVGRVVFADIGKLSLLVVRLNPNIAFHQVDDLLTRSDELTFLYMPFTNRAFDRRNDSRIAKIHVGDDDGCFFCLNLRLEEAVPRVKSRALTLFRFEERLAARESGLCARKVGLAAGEHSRKPVGIGDGLPVADVLPLLPPRAPADVSTLIAFAPRLR